MTKKIHLDHHSVNQKYFSGIWRNKCTGHKSFCEYILDYNGTFVDKAFEKAENIHSSYKGIIHKPRGQFLGIFDPIPLRRHFY